MNRFVNVVASIAVAAAFVAYAPMTLASGDLTEASNNFAATMLKNVSSQKSKENVVLSSTSLASAFALVLTGASEADQALVLKSLGYGNATMMSVLEDAKKFEASLVQNPGYSVSSKNAMFTNLPLDPKYKGLIEHFLSAENSVVNFKNENSATTINAWADKNTNGMIKEIVKAEEIDELAFLGLNATLLEAKWGYAQFDSPYAETKFVDESGSEIGKVELMTSNPAIKIAQVEYANYTAYDVPYTLDANGAPLGSMVVLLPKIMNEKEMEKALFEGKQLKPEIAPLKDVIASLNGASIAKIDADMKALRVAKKVKPILLYMPKFKTETELGDELKKMVADLGAGKIFSQIDLSNMVELPNIWDQSLVSLIKQKAVIDVAETGTKAAAVSAIGGFPASCPPPEVVLNRPFAYLIKDAATGRVIFAGTYVKP